MPRTVRINFKAEAAQSRKCYKELESLQKEVCAKENEYWSHFEAPKSRAAIRREEKLEKRAEDAARRAATRRLAEQEAEEIENATEKKVAKKVTRAELERMMEEEVKEVERKWERRGERSVSEKEYESMVWVLNRNREWGIEASSIEEAIGQLSVEAKSEWWPIDRVPRQKQCHRDMVRSVDRDFKLSRLGMIY